MNDATVGGTAQGAVTAGRLLREARQAQGLHIAALANAIKVAPRKIELLESDRLDELPDATFTRALAQTVCRSLKVNAAPILALLPPPSGHRLEHVGEGLNTPFHERPSHLVANEWASLAKPAIWAPLLLLAAAAAVYLMPAGWLQGAASRQRTAPDAATSATDGASSASASAASAPAEAATAANLPASAAAAVPTATANAPTGLPVPTPTPPATGATPLAATALPSATPTPAPASITPVATGATPAAPLTSTAAPEPAKLLRLHASTDSWIEVVDARSHVLLSRTVKAGETVDLEGPVPMRVRVGNVRGTEIVFRGQPFELAPYARDNLARLELK